MKKSLIFICLFIWSLSISAQLTQPDAAGNKKASVSERIGLTLVKIDYDRPAVKGREGKIWGGLVHYGFKDLQYGTSKAAPWRAGANENTTMEFSTDVMIEDQALMAGKYGFFIAMGTDSATIIFSNYHTAWGSFYYDAKDDALRVNVPVLKLSQSIERLKYEFTDQMETSAVINLMWEKISIPFKVSVDLQKEQIATYRRLFNSGSFYRYWQNMNDAANYCLVNDINLEEGLSWADRSIHTFFGDENFLTLSTYAGLLEKLGRKPESDSIMKRAFPMAKPLQLYRYGRSLQSQNKMEEAFDVFKLNYEKFPEDDNARLGMIIVNFLKGEKAEAIKVAEKAAKESQSAGYRGYFERLVVEIKNGKVVF
ncbi:MAG: DUF2911 domain-containing protein [Saprospiraceae bacterium]